MEYGKTITDCWGASFTISPTTAPLSHPGKKWSFQSDFNSLLHASTFVSTLSDFDLKSLCHRFCDRGLGNSQDIQKAIFNGQLKVFPETDQYLTSVQRSNGHGTSSYVKPIESRSLLAIRSDIKTTLIQIVDQERLETEQIEKSYQKHSALGKAGAHINQFASGLYNSGESLLIWLKDINDVVNTNQRLLRIMKAASVAQQADENDRYQVFQNTLAASEKKEIIEALGFDPSLFTSEKVTPAYELAHLVYEDQLTQLILKQFIKNYIDAQHSLEWSKFAGGAAFEVILTAILTIFTGGVGLVASMGAKARHVLQLNKLGKLFLELAEGLRIIPKERYYSLRKAKEKEDKARRQKAASKRSGSETKSANDGTMLEESIAPDNTTSANGDKSSASNIAEKSDKYAELVNSNKPWSWKDFPEGESLTIKQKREIKADAIKRGLIPDIPFKPGTKYPDFEAAGLIETVDELPEELWKETDYKQFKWLDSRISGGRPEGFTWHHSEVPGRMELVPFGPHNSINHKGGRSKGNWGDGKR